MKITLFNKEINIKEHYCSCNKKEYLVESPYTNLYVQFKGCNAKCKFCEYSDCANTFNMDKFKNIIEELNNQIDVRKISLTGGEATINKHFYDVVDIVKNTNAFLVVNTNGSNLKEVHKRGYIEKFDSIALSRHHFDDDINNEILGLKSISTEDLKDMKLKNLHLTCNLQKDFIHNKETIYKYLEYVSSMNYDDVGFVSLMQINDFAKEQFVDFETIDLESETYHKMTEWRNKDSCKCNNYLYIAEENVVKVYSRYFMKATEFVSSLIFDGENLKTGFNGEILI